MMIKKISANKSSFKTVTFEKGFNVIWADRTKESTKKDSRNGLGKSTLIEIIHFCLGAKTSKGKGLLAEALKGWEFTLKLEVEGEEVSVTRSVDKPTKLIVKDTHSERHLESGMAGVSLQNWNELLGRLFFEIPVDLEEKYQPTFRSLISYFIRRGHDAFSIPFEHHRKQNEWDKQVCNAFLLGLAWEDAGAIQLLKDRKKSIDAIRKVQRSGGMKEFFGSLGDLNARMVALKNKVEQEKSNLNSFRVHPQYEEMRVEANTITSEIHEAVNKNLFDERMLELYEKSLINEMAPEQDSVKKLYAEAGVALPDITLRRLEEAEEFHSKVIRNRRSFLADEVLRLKRRIVEREEVIKAKTEQRALVMEILQTHGALEEYTLLQNRHLESTKNLNIISSQIENLKTIEESLSQLKIEQEVLQQKARRDYEERKEIREKAISLFNSYSQQLYNVPGKLVIDIGPAGFKFDVEINRSGSTGIDKMKVFCYDMTLASVWSRKKQSPKFLVHDSIIFDGVDKRQYASALQIAANESNSGGFQYICALNSDSVPWGEFVSGFNIKNFIRVKLTDENVEGTLLGIQF